MAAKTIDGKFGIEIRFDEAGGQVPVIVNLETGIAIPDEEPLFLIRGKDQVATALLIRYLELCHAAGCDNRHLQRVIDKIADFIAFERVEHARMKRPD